MTDQQVFPSGPKVLWTLFYSYKAEELMQDTVMPLQSGLSDDTRDPELDKPFISSPVDFQ